MIIAIGIDIVEVYRIRETVERTPRFVTRVFTTNERAYCEGKGEAMWQSYAGRYAARVAGVRAVEDKAAPGRHDVTEAIARNLFKLDLVTGTIAYVTYGDWRDDQPRWAPDGRIFFTSDRDGAFQIYSVDAAGSGRRAPTPAGPGPPDGRPPPSAGPAPRPSRLPSPASGT